MIIGIFTDTFYPEVNGVATSCLNLYQQLQKRGHTVHVYAPKCKGWEALQSDTVHYLESAQFILLKDRNVAFPGMGTIRQALDMHFDVVHTNSEFVMGFLGTYIARHTGCVRVHTYHTVWEDYTYYVTHGLGDNTAKSFAKKYSEWWCDRFDRVIVPTAKTENLLRQYGVEAPIDIIPSGMDLERFSPERHSAEEKAATRVECGIPEGKRVLLNIGRLAKEKNIEKILRVFPELHKRCPDVQLVIIGEGPLRQELQEQAAQIIADNQLNVRQAEALCKKLAKPAKEPKEPEPRGTLPVEVEESLKQVLGSEVNVAYHGGKGKLTVHFYSDEQLRAFANLLGQYQMETE